ncbi:hypothetical protein PQR51_29630 [Caballeronia grimmiae]
MLRSNAEIATEIVDRTVLLAPDAIYVIAADPCDVRAGDCRYATQLTHGVGIVYAFR